jgi:hypothetical protein
MKQKITLDVLPKDGNRILEELSKGNIVAVRSKNDFMYVLDNGKDYRLFSHTSGTPKGGLNSFPKNEKYTAIIRSFAEMSDTLFVVEFNSSMNLFGVLASAEEGILCMYPGNNRDADEMVEFFVPQEKTKNKEVSANV